VVGTELAVAARDWAGGSVVDLGEGEVEVPWGLGVLGLGCPRVGGNAMNSQEVSVKRPLDHGLVALGAVDFGFPLLLEREADACHTMVVGGIACAGVEVTRGASHVLGLGDIGVEANAAEKTCEHV
jgi:hypothetical protein